MVLLIITVIFNLFTCHQLSRNIKMTFCFLIDYMLYVDVRLRSEEIICSFIVKKVYYFIDRLMKTKVSFYTIMCKV